MQDRFRFRAWDKEKNIMIYNAEETYDYPCGRGCEAQCFGDVCLEDDYILMQCTGLKDKNGKLIYEGDIISDKSNHIRICVWEYDGFKYPALKTSRYFHKPISNKLEERKIDLRKKLTFQDTVYKCDKKEFVVIGNIYQDKELLND